MLKSFSNTRVQLALAQGVLMVLMGWVTLISLAPRAQSVPPDILESLAEATVYIESEMVLSNRDWNALSEPVREKMGERPHATASGSGFLITRDGLVVTNAHVVNEMAREVSFGPEQKMMQHFLPVSIKVVLRSGRDEEKSYRPRIVGMDDKIDLALLSASDHKFGDVLSHAATCSCR